MKKIFLSTHKIGTKTNKLRKIFIATGILVSLTLSSCRLTERTATIVTPQNQIVTTSVAADLEVSPNRITYVYNPPRSVNRGGFKNVVYTAVAEALQNHGGAHVLVGLEYTVKSKAFGRKFVKEITVNGFPAKYKNFRKYSEADASSLAPTIYEYTKIYEQTIKNKNK